MSWLKLLMYLHILKNKMSVAKQKMLPLKFFYLEEILLQASYRDSKRYKPEDQNHFNILFSLSARIFNKIFIKNSLKILHCITSFAAF